MRWGMSWPTGRGRRQWVSYGPVGTAVIGLLTLAWVILWCVLLVLYAIGWGAAWVVSRPFVARKAHRAPAAASR